MILPAIFYVFFLPWEIIDAGAVRSAEDFQNNLTVSQIPRVDVFGPFISLLDGFLSQSARGRPPPEPEACKGTLIKLGESEIKVSQNPYGGCAYCCPISNPSRHINLYFTNKANAGNTVRLKMGRKPGALRSAGVNKDSPTVIFIHGFTEHGLGPAARTMRDAYLSRSEDHNIILVDWGDLAPMPWYPQAVKSVKMAGGMLSAFLKFYHDTGELPISKVHIVGFSLGAHMAGFVGKFLGGTLRIPRITALEPALPMFPLDDKTQRISELDADYVDVIHTDAGRFGFPISVGHADFYPNGGSFVQPGCEVSKLAERKIIEQFGTCEHLRAWRLYAESVRSPHAFPATKCGIMHNGSLKQCRFVMEGYMGFAASKNTALGDFYLTTNDRKPYARSARDQEGDMKIINLVL